MMMSMGMGGGGGYRSTMMGMMGGGGPPVPPPPAPTPWAYWTDLASNQDFNVLSMDSFRDIGHALFALIVAALGGWFARAVHDSREDETTRA
jgi:hypothetical protein